MSVTATFYNHTTRLLANESLDLTSLKISLVNGYVFDATDTVWADASNTEVSGNGWPSGGPTLTGVSVSTINTDDATLDANDVVVTATTGPIGPATGAVLRETTNDKLLIYIDFGQVLTASTGTDFKFTWAAAGIITWQVT